MTHVRDVVLLMGASNMNAKLGDPTDLPAAQQSAHSSILYSYSKTLTTGSGTEEWVKLQPATVDGDPSTRFGPEVPLGWKLSGPAIMCVSNGGKSLNDFWLNSAATRATIKGWWLNARDNGIWPRLSHMVFWANKDAGDETKADNFGSNCAALRNEYAKHFGSPNLKLFVVYTPETISEQPFKDNLKASLDTEAASNDDIVIVDCTDLTAEISGDVLHYESAGIIEIAEDFIYPQIVANPNPKVVSL